MANLVDINKTELRKRYENLLAKGRSARAKAAAPIKQGGMGLSIVAGASLGSTIAAVKPTVFKVPTDALVGVGVALPCLFLGAGKTPVDAVAFAGYGSAAGSAGRLLHDAVRDKLESNAAEGGDALAKQIVATQKSLNELRAKRADA